MVSDISVASFHAEEQCGRVHSKSKPSGRSRGYKFPGSCMSSSSEVLDAPSRAVSSSSCGSRDNSHAVRDSCGGKGKSSTHSERFGTQLPILSFHLASHTGSPGVHSSSAKIRGSEKLSPASPVSIGGTQTTVTTVCTPSPPSTGTTSFQSHLPSTEDPGWGVSLRSRERGNSVMGESAHHHPAITPHTAALLSNKKPMPSRYASVESETSSQVSSVPPALSCVLSAPAPRTAPSRGVTATSRSPPKSSPGSAGVALAAKMSGTYVPRVIPTQGAGPPSESPASSSLKSSEVTGDSVGVTPPRSPVTTKAQFISAVEAFNRKTQQMMAARQSRLPSRTVTTNGSATAGVPSRASASVTQVPPTAAPATLQMTNASDTAKQKPAPQNTPVPPRPRPVPFPSSSTAAADAVSSPPVGPVQAPVKSATANEKSSTAPRDGQPDGVAPLTPAQTESLTSRTAKPTPPLAAAKLAKLPARIVPKTEETPPVRPVSSSAQHKVLPAAARDVHHVFPKATGPTSPTPLTTSSVKRPPPLKTPPKDKAVRVPANTTFQGGLTSLPVFLSSQNIHSVDGGQSDSSTEPTMKQADSSVNAGSGNESRSALNIGKISCKSRLCDKSMFGDAAEAHPQHSTAAERAPRSEEVALIRYLGEEELNFSMSTFTLVGPTLAASRALRVLNLKGSTVTSEGLWGLADIPTLKSLCVSHMRHLTSLVPVITSRLSGCKCALEELDAQCTPLENEGIVGLEKLPKLRYLDLSRTRITSVSHLAHSRSLVELYLTATSLNSDGIAGLEQIHTLTILNVCRTKVTDLGRLVQSCSLEELFLNACKITDEGITGIADMPALRILDVSSTKVTDLSVMSSSLSLETLTARWLSLRNTRDIIQERRAQQDGLTAMETLGTCEDQEAGFAGLACIPTLETLDLSYNCIRSVHSLCLSRSLRHLYLRRTMIHSQGLTTVGKLARTLQTLVVTNITDNVTDELSKSCAESSSNSVGILSSVDMLAGLIKLVKLDVSFTDAYDLRLLRSLKHLKELLVVETLVTVDGLRGIEHIPTLEVLDVSQTSVLSLQFLTSGCTSLKTIYARSNRNERGFRLGNLDRLPSLETLDISDTVVEDSRMAWKSTCKLKHIVWRWGERREATGPVAALPCWVTASRLEGIGKMPCLASLDISKSLVDNLDFLNGAAALQTLVLKGCRLLRDAALSSVGLVPTLHTLDLSNNPFLTSVACLRDCPNLSHLTLTNTGVTQDGLGDVPAMPSLKCLEFANTQAEETILAKGELPVDGPYANSTMKAISPHRHLKVSMSFTPQNGVSALLESILAPPQFRLPRRRRVSFVHEEVLESPSSD